MNEKKIKVIAEFEGLVFNVYVTVSEDAWLSHLSTAEEEVRADIANCEDEIDSDDFKDSGGYIGYEGHSHDCNAVQARMAYHLMGAGGSYGFILYILGALEDLRDAMVDDLNKRDTEHQYERELQMLKGITDLQMAMLGFNEDTEINGQGEEDPLITIWDRYPLELLDELAERIDGVPHKKTVVYLHGYGSSSKSSTATYLAKKMPECNVIAPDIPVDPKEALPFLKDYCYAHHADLVIGTSMGGMYAMQMTGHLRICVNPALHLSQLTDVLKVGSFEYFQPTADGRTHYTITEEIIQHFKEMEEHMFDRVTYNDYYNCWGYFADGDTLVNCKTEFAEHFYQVNDFHGEHRMNNTVLHDVIIPAARRILKE